MSVNVITNKGGLVLFDRDTVKVFQNVQSVEVNGDLSLSGKKNNNGLYEIDLSDNNNNGHEALLTQEQSTEWHKKLGHINYQDLKKVPTLCNGVTKLIEKCDVNSFCESCVVAKQRRNLFNTVRQRATRPLQILHTDLCGKISPTTYRNEECLLTVMDDYTHLTRVFLLRYKFEASTYIKEFIAEAVAHFNNKQTVEKIRCDNGGEYVSNDFKLWCKNKGIVIDFTVPHSPQLNGKSERLNLTIMNKVRAMLHDSKLSNKMWDFAAETAVYLLNRSPTSTTEVTPIEMWTSKKPDLSKLMIFGSVVYTKALGHLKKLDDRGEKGILVGYTYNGYRVWNSKKRECYESRDVRSTDLFEPDHQDSDLSTDGISISDLILDEIPQANEQNHTEEQQNQDDEENQEYEEDDDSSEDVQEQENQERPQRQRRMPVKFQDYVLYALNTLTYEECINSPDRNKWEIALKEEKDNLHRNNTWENVDEKQAVGKEIVSSFWLLKVKEDGRHEARLVARGCQQREFLDFEYTFSSVVQTNSLRLLLSIAAAEDLKITTFDIKSAFLYGDLQEEIYMRLPDDMKLPGKICRLIKSIYGLKQAPQQWFKKLTNFLISEGLNQLQTDQCVFKSQDSRDMIYVAIHVDDGIVVGRGNRVNQLLKRLSSKFQTKVNYKPEIYLGMQIQQREDGVFINQENYAKQVVEKYNMAQSKEVNTPTAPQDRVKEDENFQTNFPYQQAVGSLLYLSIKTRPDMCFAVNYASRYNKSPRSQDLVNVKRTLRYIKGSSQDGILYQRSNNNESPYTLDVYCDSDHGGDRDDCKSTTGYIMFYAGGPVAWCSRKQSVVAQSSTEAEYVAAAQCVKEMKYVKTVLEELLPKKIQVTLFLDNQSCIQMIQANQLTRKCIHIDVKYHFVKEEYKKKWFKIIYVPTDCNLADCFTKPLVYDKFVKCINRILH